MKGNRWGKKFHAASLFRKRWMRPPMRRSASISGLGRPFMSSYQRCRISRNVSVDLSLGRTWAGVLGSSTASSRSRRIVGSSSRRLRSSTMTRKSCVMSWIASKWSRRSPSTWATRIKPHDCSSLRLLLTLERATPSASAMSSAGSGRSERERSACICATGRFTPQREPISPQCRTTRSTTGAIAIAAPYISFLALQKLRFFGPPVKAGAQFRIQGKGEHVSSKLLAGASGYSFKEWKGNFYPEKMKPEEMLQFYAQRLPTVEINNTFYRMPKTTVLENWAGTVPEDFRFAIKASRRTTHMARIKAESSAESLAYLYKNLVALGPKLGTVLFQLPPNLKNDLPRLSAFLALLPEGHRAAFEFRNDTWFDDEVYAALKGAGAALVLSEREDNAPPPLVETASWGYVRLRLETYSDDDLKQWAEKLAATKWRETFVYFMHEPTAPAYSRTLMKLAQ